MSRGNRARSSRDELRPYRINGQVHIFEGEGIPNSFVGQGMMIEKKKKFGQMSA